jgi:hypothetical protein
MSQLEHDRRIDYVECPVADVAVARRVYSLVLGVHRGWSESSRCSRRPARCRGKQRGGPAAVSSRRGWTSPATNPGQRPARRAIIRYGADSSRPGVLCPVRECHTTGRRRTSHTGLHRGRYGPALAVRGRRDAPGVLSGLGPAKVFRHPVQCPCPALVGSGRLRLAHDQ